MDISNNKGSGELGTFGYGMYKITIKNLRTARVDSCLMEFDYGGLEQSDLYFKIYDDTVSNHYRFSYRFNWVLNDTLHVPINYDSLRGYKAETWRPNSYINNNHSRPKNFGPEGGFILKNYDTLSLKYYGEYFPLDSRIHCDYINSSLGFYLAQNHKYPYPFEEPPVSFFDERHGILTLNLTIKRRVITPPYRSDFSIGNPNPTQIIVSPGVTLSILQNNPKRYPDQENCYNGIVLGKYWNDDVGNELIVKGSNSEYNAGKLLLGSSNDADSNNRVVINKYGALKLEPTSILEMGEKADIYLDVWSNDTLHKGKLISYSNSNIITHPSSKIYIRQNGQFENYGANITNSSNFHIEVLDGGKYSIKAENYVHIVNNGAFMNIRNGTLEIAKNSILTFDGSGSYCSISSNSNIILGENAAIEFKNGAYLIANEGTISSLNSSTPGKGFIFENAGTQTSITNCTFNDLTNSIYLYSTTAGSSGEYKYINNNIFNTNNFCNYVIETKNTNNITISNNHIYMQTGKGIGILMRYFASSGDGEAASAPYFVNVFGNEILNGSISAAFISLTNAFAGINFRNNNCYGSPAIANIIERQISGDIKYNTLSSGTSKNLELNQSNPYVYFNTFNTTNLNLNNYASYPLFAPVSENTTDGGWIWHGGKNKIYSTGEGNINYNDGNVALDWGQNCFLKNVNYRHLKGQINQPSLHYLVRDNDFNGSNIPDTYLFDQSSGYEVLPYFTGSNFSCINSTDGGTIWMIRNLGNGLYDTLYKTSKNSGYQPSPDEVLFSSAIQKKALNDNFEAISFFKALINGFPVSSNTDACLYDLYSCYVKLDTSNNQGIRDILYTDLKNYLDGKILSGQYSDEFNYTAYNITLMCLTSIADYNEAMTGYEFIALYHPDAYIRLLASWDFAEVQALLNGSGGFSNKEKNLSDEEYSAKLIKIINKSIVEDPVKSKVKKSYDKIKSEKTAKNENEVLSKNKDEKIVRYSIVRIKQYEEIMNTKVNSVLRYSKTLSSEAREKKQIEDILFTNRVKDTDNEFLNNNSPTNFELFQNYPNPFNPTTTINFAIPKNGFVTMKIYDITGREVKLLVNEYKQAGFYSINFNGSDLSSGVYFYKLSAEGFIDTKRMVLVK